MAARGWVFGVVSVLPLAVPASPPAASEDLAAAFFEFLGEEVDTDDEMGRALLSGDFAPAKPGADESPKVDEHEQQNP